MRSRIGIAVLTFACLTALAVILAEVPVQGAKPAASVPLTASFRSEVATAFPSDSPSRFVDKILNDAAGPYVTGRDRGVSLSLTSDTGELTFIVAHHATRSVRVVFPELFDETVGWLPDTAGIYPNLPDEPIDYFELQTYNRTYFAGPTENLLTMPLNEFRQIRLWTTFCTTQRHYFFMNYSHDGGKISGVVQVMALDLTGNDGKPDGKPDKWVIEPLPAPNDEAKICKQSETGKNVFYDFGYAPMRFQLVLQKQ